MSIIVSYFNSPLGIMRTEDNEKSLIRLEVVGENPKNTGQVSHFSQKVALQTEEFFQGKRKKFDIPLLLTGTPFQNKVWSALQEVPYGETASYGEIAGRLHLPHGAQAVGGACNKNPIMIIIPCHRIVACNGALTGYAYGLDMKEKILNTEKKYTC